MAADFCRLCLRPIDKAKSTDLVTETTKLAMLKEFLPEMNLDISENTQVCSSCIEELETSYNFKHGVVVNETNIQTKLEENDLKKIDLKLMLDDVAKKEVKTADYVCRTCFSICRTPSISLFDSPTNMMPYSFVKKMCQVVFELEFIAADKPVLCDDCWETLQTVYNFRKCCLRTDKKLRIFVANKNITKVNNDEFKEFAEENPPKDDAEDSSDDELDEYIKEEPVDADEIKFDPDEASCSSSSVKVKKETAVKSESELNSEDEDMEDEPELLDPKTIKSEASELDGEECKMEIGDVKVDAEGEGSAGPSGSIQGNEAEYPTPLLETPSKSQRYQTQKRKLKSSNEKAMLSCGQCAYQTQYKEYLKQHLLIHTEPERRFQCAHCQYVTLLRASLVRHLMVHATPGSIPMFQCSVCSYQTYRKTYLKLHEKIHFAGDITTKPMLECPNCSFKTCLKSYMKRHLRLHVQPITLLQYNCNDCPFRTTQKCYLRKHVKLHIPGEANSIFKCHRCSYQTKRKNRLSDHIKLHALPGATQMLTTRLLKCDRCSFQTSHKNSIKQHMKNIHTVPGTIPMLDCTHCSYQTISKFRLTRHMNAHAVPGTHPTFHCSQCNYHTYRKDLLIIHLQKHAAPGTLKMLQCHQCLYQTARRSSLVQHVKIHAVSRRNTSK